MFRVRSRLVVTMRFVRVRKSFRVFIGMGLGVFLVSLGVILGLGVGEVWSSSRYVWREGGIVRVRAGLWLYVYLEVVDRRIVGYSFFVSIYFF